MFYVLCKNVVCPKIVNFFHILIIYFIFHEQYNTNKIKQKYSALYFIRYFVYLDMCDHYGKLPWSCQDVTFMMPLIVVVYPKTHNLLGI